MKHNPTFSNPEIPEGINVSKAHPMATFIKLFSVLVIILGLSAWLLGRSGEYLAALIPFQKEARLASSYDLPNDSETEIQRYLESLSKKISDKSNLPNGMTIHIHYIDEDIENAFATLGGHIFLYKGLLDKLPNENSLSMTIAHEIAHVKHRDPIRSLGQGVAISTGLAILLGSANLNLLGSAGLYTQLKFSREMETLADQDGLKALFQVYGHVKGATTLFKLLGDLAEGDKIKTPTFFETHPLSQDRINTIQNLANKNRWAQDKAITPLPQDFKHWLNPTEYQKNEQE